MRSKPAILDVVVVGGGQAGLVSGYHLERAGLSYVILEALPRIGDPWRRRYDSLVLFSPRGYDALPGLGLPGDPDGYPTKDEIADYLETYARRLGLEVVTGAGVERLELRDGRFVARTAAGSQVAARAAVIATGPFQEPWIPAFARELAPGVRQFTMLDYRNPARLPGGRVLVVGDGASGRQIALELAGTREMTLSTGSRQPIVPQRLFGRDSMAWADRLGFLRADKASLRGRLLRANDGFPGLHLRHAALRRAGIGLRPRAIGAAGDRVRFADGAEEQFGAVVWATGYRDRAAWMAIPGAVDERGTLVEERGVGPVPGLFYMGRSWQNSRASALLCGVGDDAAGIVSRVRAHLATGP